MNIFLTGSTGFLGKNIAESFLAEKYNIIAPSHAALELLDEKAVEDFFRSRKIDVVIHSGWKPGHRNAKEPDNVLLPNLRMFFNIVRNSDYFQKIIFLGSGAAYDMRNYYPKMKESYFDTYVPVDQTGFCKYAISKHIQIMENAVDLRLFGVFGKYEDYAIRFISNAICKTLFNLPVTIRQNRKFDYLFIDDLYQILDYFIIQNPEHKAYNITPDRSVGLLKLAQIVLEISGKNLPINIAQKGLAAEYSGDNTRLKNEVNNISFTPIKQAVKNLYNWYQDNIGNINKDFLLVDK